MCRRRGNDTARVCHLGFTFAGYCQIRERRELLSCESLRTLSSSSIFGSHDRCRGSTDPTESLEEISTILHLGKQALGTYPKRTRGSDGVAPSLQPRLSWRTNAQTSPSTLFTPYWSSFISLTMQRHSAYAREYANRGYPSHATTSSPICAFSSFRTSVDLYRESNRTKNGSNGMDITSPNTQMYLSSRRLLSRVLWLISLF